MSESRKPSFALWGKFNEHAHGIGTIAVIAGVIVAVFQVVQVVREARSSAQQQMRLLQIEHDLTRRDELVKSLLNEHQEITKTLYGLVSELQFPYKQTPDDPHYNQVFAAEVMFKLILARFRYDTQLVAQFLPDSANDALNKLNSDTERILTDWRSIRTTWGLTEADFEKLRNSFIETCNEVLDLRDKQLETFIDGVNAVAAQKDDGGGS